MNDASLWQDGYGQSLCGRHDLSHQLHLDIDGPLLDLGGDGDGNLNLWLALKYFKTITLKFQIEGMAGKEH